jgi:HAD superfamily hydrolase (TIGR01509 family)
MYTSREAKGDSIVVQPIDAVIFDMDGLMLDTEPIYKLAWQRAADDLGFDLHDELYLTLIGRTNADGEALLRDAFGPTFAVDAFRQRWADYWYDQIATSGAPMKAGLDDVLRLLDEHRIPKAIATSSNRDDAVFVLNDLANRFDVLITGHDVAHGKPAPDIFLLTACRLGVAPARCLVLEDSEAGITAAHRAGMLAIMIPDLKHPSPEVAALAYRVCSSLHDVRDLLSRIYA